jgi:protein O-GlcNAc transferase
MSSPLFKKGLELFSSNRFEEAQSVFSASFKKREFESKKSLIYCIHICEQKRDFNAAIELLLDAAEMQPTEYIWLSFLADMYANLGDISNAIQYAEKSLKINSIQELTELNLVRRKSTLLTDGTEIKRIIEAWAEKYISSIETNQSLDFPKINFFIKNKLKIAYISGDLKNHSVRYFIEPYFRFHNRKKFEIHAIMTMDEDEISEILKSFVDAWHNVQDMSDKKLHTFIQSLGIDILVDLSGHTLGNRMKVFAMRAAPLQMTWFGDMNTLGIKSIDYRITDWSMCPPGAEVNYTEKLIRLGCMSSYMPPLNCELQFPSPYKTNGYVTMISLNNSRKFSDITLKTWCEILNENENVGLIIVSSEGTSEGAIQSLVPRLEIFNAPMSRIVITARLTMLEFMRMASVADFALDPFPTSGGTTTYHSLWMGLPILTLQSNGEMAVNSSTTMTLLGAGLECCMALGVKGYKDKAREWIESPRLIDDIRLIVRDNFSKCALFDYSTRVMELENEYLKLSKVNSCVPLKNTHFFKAR